uniref:phospholipase D n=1 Tax=Kalanchoe fedtschenkoi TaxID=63787 RepID=A0A7N0ZYU0_KALFE
MPHHHMVLPHYMERSKEMDIEDKNKEQDSRANCLPNSFESHTTSEDIPLLLPQEVGEMNPRLDEKTTFADMTPSPRDLSEMHFGLLDESDAQTMGDPWATDEEGNHASFEHDDGQVGPRLSCRCQIIRSVSQWSAGTSQTEDSIHTAYCSFIENAEHFIYIENQFFVSGLAGDQVIQNRVLDSIYKRILRAHREKKLFRVIVVVPLLPGFQGGLEDGGAATVRALTHWQYRTISRGRPSILYNLNRLLGPKTEDYISFYGLRNYGRLHEDGPVVTSQVYVHSKVMIIDDRTTFIGSSNINDRSLLGSRDSEIGVIIEDKEFLESSMNGEPWTAGKFAHSLRISLWAEHLGLNAGQARQIHDPIADATYKDLWLATAKANTMIYHEVFACIPNDEIHSRAALRQVRSQWKEKHGHNTIDLGVAPRKLVDEEMAESEEVIITATDDDDPMEMLKAVRGFLVCFPLEFMRDEDLRPMFNEGEFYASPQVFL